MQSSYRFRFATDRDSINGRFFPWWGGTVYRLNERLMLAKRFDVDLSRFERW